MKSFLSKNIRLSIFFFLLAFLSGRIGLFLHEFAGHALFWRLIGGNITGFRLFMFGGGWVRYGSTPSTANASLFSLLFVDLSGMVVELVVGILLAVLAIFLKCSRSLRGLLAAAASVLIVHSLFYFVICTYYGSGDGIALFSVLQGGARHGVLLFSFGLTVAGAFIVSYAFSPAVRSWVADCSSKKRILVIVLSAFCASLLHAALTFGEQVVVKDRIYGDIKTSENVRLKHKALSDFVAEYTEKHGRAPDQEQIVVVKKRLEKKYGQFPIEAPLGLAVLAAFIAGFFISRKRDFDDPDPVGWKDAGLLACVSVLVAMLVLVLNRG